LRPIGVVAGRRDEPDDEAAAEEQNEARDRSMSRTLTAPGTGARGLEEASFPPSDFENKPVVPAGMRVAGEAWGAVPSSEELSSTSTGGGRTGTARGVDRGVARGVARGVDRRGVDRGVVVPRGECTWRGEAAGVRAGAATTRWWPCWRVGEEVSVAGVAPCCAPSGSCRGSADDAAPCMRETLASACIMAVSHHCCAS
jgi:hypothetical protein